jgi:hypothetical protein
MNTTTSTEKNFFDLHVTGLGYVSRVRAVTPKKGNPYIACSISALRGEAGDKLYTMFDCAIVGAEAEKVIEMLGPDIASKGEDGKAKNKVLIGFRLGDIYPEQFTYNTGPRAGQPGLVTKGRLLKIFWAKVNGEDRYKAPVKEEDTATAAPTGTEG